MDKIVYYYYGALCTHAINQLFQRLPVIVLQIITLIRGEMAALGADITAYSLWNTVWSTVDHCWHYDLAKLTKSEPESHSVTIIHMTRGSLFQILSELRLKSLMAMTACLLFLSSSLDQIAVLGQLRGHWHVHELICNAHLKKKDH